MNFFKKFKVTFNLSNATKNKKKKDKDEVEVRCLKYRITSEFTEDQVFNTNPRHFADTPFTPTEKRKQLLKSRSENDLYWKQLATSPAETSEKERTGLARNHVWPSESNIIRQEEANIEDLQRTKGKEASEETNPDTENIREPVKKEVELQVKKEKGILKHTTIYTETDYSHNATNQVNFEIENGGEPTYEQFETIDDHIEDEKEIYYFDQNQEDEEENFIVHKGLHNQREKYDSISENEYELPNHLDKSNYSGSNGRVNVPNTASVPYNVFTHPKLNPNQNGIDSSLNTFGNTQKLSHPSDYSSQAASIFFDDEDSDFDQNDQQGIELDNVSEMSA